MKSMHMGINLGHDRSVAIVHEGKLVVAVEQERLDRMKHSVGFLAQSPHLLQRIQLPWESIHYCLDTLGLSINDLETITANMPGYDHGPIILQKNLPRELAPKVCAIPSHHLAHAYSAYWPSGFEDSLILVADASGTTTLTENGSWVTEATSLYVARGGKVEPLYAEKVQAHLAGLSTLGFVYEYIARKAGFVTQIGSHIRFAEAGKLMGLAAYGNPQPAWHRWLKPENNAPRVSTSAYDIFLEVAALEKAHDNGEGKPYFRPWLVDLAYKVQHELEEALCHIVSTALKQTGMSHLCMAGGVALNSVANYKVLQRCGLEDIFIFPAAADNGIAAGCALWAYAEKSGGNKRPLLTSATLGRAPKEEEIEASLESFQEQIVTERLTNEEMVETVSKALAQGHIVARYEGACEYGPRALGHRSILADPTFPRMKDIINARVKFREAFRPFAPVIPLARAHEVFALGTKSPFMLLVADIRPEFHDVLPAITHADGTGRVQTCTPEDNPFFTSLCHRLSDERGGPPVLLNTSFNVAGQPIVETPQEAIATFLRTDMDYLSLGNVWIRRKHQQVKSYAEHEATLSSEPLPEGLPAKSPSVLPLMKELDDALFGRQAATHWTQKELQALSQEGGRFKETSHLFPHHTFIAPLKTELSQHGVLLLNPLGQSTLADPTEERKPILLNNDEVELLLATQADPVDYYEKVRITLGLGHRAYRSKLRELQKLLAPFSVSFEPGWMNQEQRIDSPLNSTSTKTLEPFSDSEFFFGDTLSQLAETLEQFNYLEGPIATALGVDSLQSIQPTHLRWHSVYQLPQTPLADLIRIFLLRGSLSRTRLNEIFGEELMQRLNQLGLFHGTHEETYAAVDLFCSGGMWFATDHRYMIFENDHLEEEPVMYIGMDSHGLVQTAPPKAGERLLDLCSGSGVQGLVASRYMREVVAVDINPRAIRFARFNAQLNGVQNYTVREGDLFDAVKGESFDRIVANPPFVPSPEMGLTFRDGGTRGENLLQEIVKRSPLHLTPDGDLMIVTDLVDVESYHEKLKGWWGDSPMEGLILKTADRDEILFSVPHCHAPFNQSVERYHAELDRWINNYRSAKLQGVNFGYILIWKTTEHNDRMLTTRTIHNPSSPIHSEVKTWRVQQQKWRQSSAQKLYVHVHPFARLTKEHGAGESTYSITIPENDFFTTYTISSGIYDEICHIMNSPPLLKERNTSEGGWLHQLHQLGLLRLEETPKQHKHQPTSEKKTEAIEEHATKTTPTCLSSYLS